MLIESIKKLSNGKYSIVAGGKEYTFSDDVIVEWRLTVGHETSLEELMEAEASEELNSYYHKACMYSIRYSKGEAEVRSYLKEKKLSASGIQSILDKMKRNKVLNEDSLLDSLIRSYIHNGNGREMIRSKLFQKGYSREDIEAHISSIDEEEYFDSLRHMYEKAMQRYPKDDAYTRTVKVKRYLLQRGYTYSEIEALKKF